MAYSILSIDRLYERAVAGNNFVMIAHVSISDGIDSTTEIIQSIELDRTESKGEDKLIADLKGKIQAVIDKKNQDEADEAALSTKKDQLVSDLTTERYIK